LTVLVFDFGGGTLDVSLLAVYNNVFETIEVGGDDHLGGEDVNHCMMTLLVDEMAAFVVKETTTDDDSTARADEIKRQIKTDKSKMQELRQEVERMKLELSEKYETRMSIVVSDYATNKGASSDTPLVFRRELT